MSNKAEQPKSYLGKKIAEAKAAGISIEEREPRRPDQSESGTHEWPFVPQAANNKITKQIKRVKNSKR